MAFEITSGLITVHVVVFICAERKYLLVCQTNQRSVIRFALQSLICVLFVYCLAGDIVFKMYFQFSLDATVTICS